MRMFIATCLLAGCDGTTFGTAAYTCEYTYAFVEGTETGEWVEIELSCREYANSGAQQISGGPGPCEEEGYDLGATFATCTCDWVLDGGCDPKSVND